MATQFSYTFIRTLALGSLLALTPALASTAAYMESGDSVFASLPKLPLTSNDDLSRPAILDDSEDRDYTIGSVTFGVYGISIIHVAHAPVWNIPGNSVILRYYSSWPFAAGASQSKFYAGLLTIAAEVQGGMAASEADTPELATLIMIGTGLALMRLLKRTRREHPARKVRAQAVHP